MKQLRLSINERETFINNVTNLVDKGNVSQLKDLSALISKVDEKGIKKPTVYITTDVMARMEALVKESPVEISWHGLVKRNKEENCYLIYDILLFPQINSAAATQTDQDEYAKWFMEILNDEDETKFNDMRMHGHSHVNMSVYSSAIDDGYQTELLTNIQDGDYYIFMVLNKKRDICCLVYDYEQQILFETADVTIKLVSKDKLSITEWAKNQINKFCTTPKPATPSYPRVWGSRSVWPAEEDDYDEHFYRRYTR